MRTGILSRENRELKGVQPGDSRIFLDKVNQRLNGNFSQTADIKSVRKPSLTRSLCYLWLSSKAAYLTRFCLSNAEPAKWIQKDTTSTSAICVPQTVGVVRLSVLPFGNLKCLNVQQNTVFPVLQSNKIQYFRYSNIQRAVKSRENNLPISVVQRPLKTYRGAGQHESFPIQAGKLIFLPQHHTFTFTVDHHTRVPVAVRPEFMVEDIRHDIVLSWYNLDPERNKSKVT